MQRPSLHAPIGPHSCLISLAGSYTNHEFVCHLTLNSYDQMPETFDKNFYVEFTQPATTVSHTVLRSVSIQNGSGEPPEKSVKYLARHEYKLEIEFSEKEQNTYVAVVSKREDARKHTEGGGGGGEDGKGNAANNDDSEFEMNKKYDSDSDSD